MTDSDQNNQVQAMHPKYDEHEGLSIIKTVADMQSQFSRMQNLSRTQPINDWATRRDQLDNLELMLSDNQQLLANAISADWLS